MRFIRISGLAAAFVLGVASTATAAPTPLRFEQNAKVALETAHYGYVLEIGRVVMNDTCERLMNSKDIQEFYLGAKEEGARGERRWKKKKTWR